MKRALLICLTLSMIALTGGVVLAENKPATPCPMKATACKKKAYVNLDAVWRASEKGKASMTVIEKKVEDGKTEILKLREEIQPLKDQFDKAANEQDKAKAARMIEEKRRVLMDLSAMKNKEINDLRIADQEKFVAEIIPIVNKYRQEQGIMVIQRFTPNEIISVDPSIDITEEILQLYNAQK